MVEKSEDLQLIQAIIIGDDDDKLAEYLSEFTDIDQVFPSPFEENRYTNLSELFINKPSLLCAAAFYGSQKCISYLLANGAAVDYRDLKNRTPIFYAVANNNLESIDSLYYSGAELEAVDDDGMTLLHFAVIFESFDALVWNYGIGTYHVSVKDKKGQTPLHLAASSMNTQILSFLCDCGADPNAKSSKQATPFHYAALKPNIENLRILLKAGADISAKDNGGLQPYHWAEVKNLVENMEFMLDHGARVRSIMH